MKLLKDTPMELGFLAWQLEPPRRSAMVVIKATYMLQPGECPLAPEPAPCTGDVFFEDVDAQSLRYESDFAIYKPHPEWLLIGSAYTPDGAPQTLLPVRAQVGAVSKELVVYGNRYWQAGPTGAVATEPQPFVQMPLRYERSFGGARVDENPIGIGAEVLEHEGQRYHPLPNIEDASDRLEGPADRPQPAGFGPISRVWEARMQRTGTYDKAWAESRWPYYPEDFDWSYHCAAPEDQRAETWWRGDEAIVLEGLHPTHAQLETKLPGLRPRCFISRKAPAPAYGAPPTRVEAEALDEAAIDAPPPIEEVGLLLDTVTIDTDAGQVHCLWRGLIHEVADDQLSDIHHLYMLHEGVEERHDLAYYAEAFRRKLQEEADEDFDLEAEEPPAEDEPEEPEPSPRQKELEEVQKKLEEELELPEGSFPMLIEAFPEIEPPKPSELKEALAAAGEEIPPVIEALEDLEVPAEEPEEEADRVRREALLARLERTGSLAGEDLSGLNLSGLDLRGYEFRGADFSGANLWRTKLDASVLDGANLEGVDLREASLRGTSFREATLDRVQADQAQAAEAIFDGADGEGASFVGADLSGASLLGTTFEEGDFREVDLRDAKGDGSDFSGSKLQDADLSGASLVDAWFEGVSAQRARFIGCAAKDFRGSDGADFSGALFRDVVAPGSQWQTSRVAEVDFSGADLTGADFSECSLPETVLARARMRGACFDRADLRQVQALLCDALEASFDGANLSGADLRGANLFGSQLWRAVFAETNVEMADVGRTHLEGRV